MTDKPKMTAAELLKLLAEEARAHRFPRGEDGEAAEAVWNALRGFFEYPEYLASRLGDELRSRGGKFESPDEVYTEDVLAIVGALAQLQRNDQERAASAWLRNATSGPQHEDEPA